MQTLKATLDMIRSLKSATGMKVSRNFEGFFADRIAQSFSEATLTDCIEHLAKSLNAQVEYVGSQRTLAFMQAANSDDSYHVLAWIHEHPKVIALIAGLRDDKDYQEAIECIEIDTSQAIDDSVVTSQPGFDISIKAKLLSPLAHGADGKSGNATLFRRRQVITDTGKIMALPFYAGNALRGQIRDLLADHFLSSLGLATRRDKPAINLWFFHILYAGGVLEEQSKAMNDINSELGKHGSVRTEGIRRLRDMLPGLSILGSAIGNKIIPGRLSVGDFRPACREWGLSNVPVSRIMEWTFLTRRDDYEGRGENDDHAGMIANTEVIKEGTIMYGGIDIDKHASDIERSALALGLNLVAEKGRLGAENRRGLGIVEYDIECEYDAGIYQQFLQQNKAEIVEYLDVIGAINAPG